MNVLTRSICIVALVSAVAAAQDHAFSTKRSYSPPHSKDSFVLVFGSQSIQRGSDYSTRTAALKYQKVKRIRDLAWFSTREGCFANAAPKIIASLKETEKPQDVLAKEEDRLGGRNLTAAQQLSRQQTQLTWQPDETVWGLFDKLRGEGHLSSVKCH